MTPEPFLAGYPATAGDEVVGPGGRLRSDAAPLHALLRHADLAGLAAAADLEFRHRCGPLPVRQDGRLAERFVPLDAVPRVLPAAEWRTLAAGVAQRHRALEAFLTDAYRAAGRRRGDPDRAPEVVRAGVLPEWSVLRSPAPARPAVGLATTGQRRVSLLACDVVRTGDGRWLVIADDARSSTGLGLALGARAAVAAVAPDLCPGVPAADPADALAELHAALEAAAPPACSGVPSVAVLTAGDVDGPGGEDALLAEALGAPLVTAGDLWGRADGGITAVVGGSRYPVDVLWLRLDEGDLAALPTPVGRPLAPLLAEAVRAGRLGLVNVPGSGLADDPTTFASVPRLVRFYLGEEPLLDQVPTWVLADEEQWAGVRARLHELVLVPVAGYGGGRRIVGPDCTPAQLTEVQAEIAAAPHRFVARAVVRPSTAPTLVSGRPVPRQVDLRVFSAAGAGQTAVLPAPLTRVALAEEAPDTDLRGHAGVKDTWVLTS